ncbi:MAG: recombinase family protein [Oscillospiraceae bacterium]|nr:recombinase family protein [Oscillospiraceae bacterium]
MNVAYVRVSTAEQNEERQVQALEAYQIEKWFKEKVSAKDTNRPQLQAMLEYVREGDIVCVHDFSRLARSTADLLAIVELLKRKDVVLISVKENFDTSTPTGKLLLTMIAAINEFERENLLERQREGIAIAKAKGKYKGRKKITREKFKIWNELYERYQIDRTFSKSAFARRLKISRNTLDKLLKEENAERKNQHEAT